MGPKAEDGTKASAVIGTLGSAEGVGESSTAAMEGIAVLPDLPDAVVEQHKRQADLERLNELPEQTATAIHSMDMMGEYGSKVGWPGICTHSEQTEKGDRDADDTRSTF